MDASAHRGMCTSAGFSTAQDASVCWCPRMSHAADDLEQEYDKHMAEAKEAEKAGDTKKASLERHSARFPLSVLKGTGVKLLYLGLVPAPPQEPSTHAGRMATPLATGAGAGGASLPSVSPGGVGEPRTVCLPYVCVLNDAAYKDLVKKNKQPYPLGTSRAEIVAVVKSLAGLFKDA